MTLRAGIFGVGAAMPDHVVTNADWEARLETSDAWIQRRTGIVERRWIEPLPAIGGDRSTVAVAEPPARLADLAVTACAAALADAGRSASDVDRVLAATVTPDLITPGLAPELALRLGAGEVPASDVGAACAGFLYALDEAAALVESGRAQCVLVCGADALSRMTDRTDRGTAVLFGDGAGAVVVAAGDLDVGCARFSLGSDAAQTEHLYADQHDRVLRMNGQEVYRHAVRRMVQATREAAFLAGLGLDDLDLLIAHQANTRIVESVARELGMPAERVVFDVARAANTSSASIPLAMARAQEQGRLKPGMIIGLAAFGAGFVWGAGVVSFKERADVLA